MTMLARALSFGLLALVLANPLAAQQPSQPEAATGTAARSLVQARHQMVAAANPLAAEAGPEALMPMAKTVVAAARPTCRVS